MKTVVIIGGSQKHTFEQYGKKKKLKVLFHNGKTGGGRVKEQFRSIIKIADGVVVLQGAVCHASRSGKGAVQMTIPPKTETSKHRSTLLGGIKHDKTPGKTGRY